MTDESAPSLDITAFSRHFHALIDYNPGADNIISSPLGAWLLLAQTAGPNPGALTSLERERIQTWLGCDITTAYHHLDRLLNSIPEPVKLAVAAWFESNFGRTMRVSTWRNNLLPAIETADPLPSKQELDEWAAKNTLGIIPQFPIDEKTLNGSSLLFSNALATKIAWAKPFDEVENPLPFWHQKTLLKANSNNHSIHFTRDEEGNLFAVVRNGDSTGLNVYAVIAENPDLGPQHVIEFAEKYASEGYRAAVQPADLPATGTIYTMTDMDSMNDFYTAILPAWTAEATLDLSKMNMPFPEALRAVTDMPLDGIEALQVAKAEYNKFGFEAAAISALRAFASGLPRMSPHKRVDIQFAHPYAVVATYRNFRRTEETSPWSNLPLFSAWVHKAAAVSDKKFA